MANWYLGAPPPISGDLGWDALYVLERLWPEHLNAVLATGWRGPAVIAPLIDLGLTLAACENLVGFDEVLARIRKGEQAALSEAKFATALVKLGYNPELEPVLKGKRLDALVYVGEEKVYTEVVTPESSSVTKQIYRAMEVLANKLVEQNPGASIDVYLVADLTFEVSNAILSFIRALPPAASDVIHELPSIAYLRYGLFQPDLSSFQPIPNADERPILGVVSGEIQGRHGTRANVRCRLTDERAGRLMDAEGHHFSRDETNLLVMDVSSVQHGIRAWIPLIQRRFQSTINRRFGAVVLLDSVSYKAAVRRRWSVLPNPFAYRPPPQTLLDGIASLDESAQLDDEVRDIGNDS